MDATHNMFCRQDDLSNPLSSMGMQVSCILVVSHFFNVVLRTMGQAGPIAQILAGLVLGPSALSHYEGVKKIFILQSSTNYYEVVSFFCRILFMFLFGLEINLQYTIRNLRLVSLVACGGAVMGGIFGLSVSFYLYQELEDDTSMTYFCLIIMLVIAYTSSPIVIRLTAELKIAASKVGRIAVSSALITEMGCLLLFNLIVNWHARNLFSGLGCMVVTAGVVVINKHLSAWLNKGNRSKKYMKAPELLFILLLLVASSVITEIWGFDSIMNCFIIGLMFPKVGKTARTLLHKLRYAIYNFVLPVYFGYIGFQCNLHAFKDWQALISVAILILLSIAGKLSGTLIVCRFLQIPTSEGIFLGFILNSRGYADLLFIGAASRTLIDLGADAYNVLLVSIVLNTIISGIIVAVLTRREVKMFANSHVALELQQMEDELRIMACAYDPRQVSAILALILAINGARTAPSVSFLLHLIELVKKIKSNLLYHQKENPELSDDEDFYGGNDAAEIQDAIDSFTAETKLLIQQRKAVSSFSCLYEDICNDAEDLYVSIILLPFHKHQRIDGKLESGKEGIRTTNQKVLRHAPCSVGIIVERGISRAPRFSQLISSETVQYVATLFFGGSDDREAIAWSLRIAEHSRVHLTIVRFLLASSSQNDQIQSGQQDDKEILMSLSGEGTVNEIDNAFMVDFYNRHVASGQIGYVEKFVNNGAETVAALKDMGDLYSLFIVGKGGRGHCSLTIGMSDWEECPELGTVGDVLASSDFDIKGSVLVIQQHRDARKVLMHEL